MEGDPEFYRQRAAECARLGRISTSPEVRRMFGQMAQTWRRLAAETECCEALVQIWGVPHQSEPEQPSQKAV
jgi:hypothetical protein